MKVKLITLNNDNQDSESEAVVNNSAIISPTNPE